MAGRDGVLLGLTLGVLSMATAAFVPGPDAPWEDGRQRPARLASAVPDSAPGGTWLRRIEQVDHKTSTAELGLLLDELRGGPLKSDIQERLRTGFVDRRSPLYSNRAGADVARLRAYALLILAERGETDAVWPAVVEELVSSDAPYVLAVMARITRQSEAPRRAAMRGALARLVSGTVIDAPVRLSRFSQSGPAETSVRAEAQAALARGEGLPGNARDADVVASDSLRFRSEWIPASERKPLRSAGLLVRSHLGEATTLEALLDRPAALTFFYTQCHNAQRCSRTVNLLADLRRGLDRAGISEETRVIGVSYEPEIDGPVQLKRYATTRGLAQDNQTRLVAGDPARFGELLEELRVPVNFDGGVVNTHGVILYVLDSRGQIARTYHSVHWQDVDVVEDLRRLIAEGGTSDRS